MSDKTLAEEIAKKLWNPRRSDSYADTLNTVGMCLVPLEAKLARAGQEGPGERMEVIDSKHIGTGDECILIERWNDGSTSIRQWVVDEDRLESDEVRIDISPEGTKQATIWITLQHFWGNRKGE